MIDAFPTEFDEVFCRSTFETYWSTPVQLSSIGDAAESLAMLTGAALRISNAWDCTIHIAIHPDGDGGRTGHMAYLEVEHGTAWVRIWPTPSHHDWLIPSDLLERLEERGWIANEDMVEENPAARIPELTCEDCGYQLPLPMLTLDAVCGDTREFAEHLVTAVREVSGVTHDRWYLRADVWAVDGGRLDIHEAAWDHEYRGWVLRIASVLPPSATVEAIWPAGGRTARQACEMGMHQFHYGPCVATSAQQAAEPSPDDFDEYAPLDWNPSRRSSSSSVSDEWDTDQWERWE